MTRRIALVLLATLSPISELRGGIPLGIFLGLEPLLTFCIAVIANAVLFSLILLALHLFYDTILSRLQLFNHHLDSVRRKGKPKVDKYGFPALTLFVAFTFAYHRRIHSHHFKLVARHELAESLSCYCIR